MNNFDVKKPKLNQFDIKKKTKFNQFWPITTKFRHKKAKCGRKIDLVMSNDWVQQSIAIRKESILKITLKRKPKKMRMSKSTSVTSGHEHSRSTFPRVFQSTRWRRIGELLDTFAWLLSFRRPERISWAATAGHSDGGSYLSQTYSKLSVGYTRH